MKNPAFNSTTNPRRGGNGPTQRLTPLAAALAAGLFALPSAPAQAAVIFVDGSTCSLVGAINNANNGNDGGNGCAAGSAGPDTLVLTANQTLTTVNNTTFGPTGLPLVTSQIIIEGDDHRIARVSTDPFRILAINSTGNLTLQQTAVSGGLLTTGSDDGAGITCYGGSLSLVDSTVSGNTGVSAGGGIYSSGCTLTVSHSTVSGNSAGNAGGGISNFYGSLTVSNSTISGNIAANGGGVFNYYARTAINNSTVTGNTAPDNQGAGVATYGGGGTSFRVATSIVAGNQGPDVDRLSGPNFTSLGDNLIGDGNATAAFNASGDQVGVTDPGLQPLADNGGPTLTHALNTLSPAVDAVTGTCPPPATDQRGVARPFDGDGNLVAACDIGAFEANADTTPNAFSFPSHTNVGLSSTQVSDLVTITGINVPAAISASAGSSYEINLDGVFRTTPSTISNGDKVRVAHFASAAFSTAFVSTLSIGGVNGTFTSTTLAADTTPNAFTFMDQTNVSRNSVRTSNAVTITGINAPTPISIQGGGYSIGCTGSFTTAAGTINPGQTVCVRHTSAPTFNAGRNTILTVGGVSDTFTSATAPNAIAQLLGVVLQVITGLVGTVLGVLGP
ncbi:MAG: choice-of-anchor Q domain-containing protein [Panacagrimonas sp.]